MGIKFRTPILTWVCTYVSPCIYLIHVHVGLLIQRCGDSQGLEVHSEIMLGYYNKQSQEEKRIGGEVRNSAFWFDSGHKLKRSWFPADSILCTLCVSSSQNCDILS